jgi:Ca-activated chloride channel family protein
VTFASPWFLAALVLVPLVLGLALWLDRRRTRYTVAFTNLELLAAVAPARRRPLRWLPLVLFLLALAAASTALARPNAKVSVPSDKATIVLLVDVSGSMRAADVKPTRLGAAQKAMSAFADKVPRGVRLGLVSFSSDPDLLVIPTTDRAVLHEGIDLLVPEAGTAIGDGLGMAVQVVKTTLAGAPKAKDGKVPGAIVLLSDGASTKGSDPRKVAQEAKRLKIPIYAVALGTPNGMLRQPDGKMSPVPPDTATLDAIARTTGGRSFTAPTARDLEAVYANLGKGLATRKEKQEITAAFAGGGLALLLAGLVTGLLRGGRLP